MPVDKRELAQALLAWEGKKQELEALEEQIKAWVLELQETTQVGYVVAKYFGGRTSYDYEGAGKAADPDIIAAHTKIEKTTDWRKVCQDADIKAPIGSRSDPSVSISISK